MGILPESIQYGPLNSSDSRSIGFSFLDAGLAAPAPAARQDFPGTLGMNVGLLVNDGG